MFAQIVYPSELSPEELDNYLSNGWFRMRQAIFTTNFLQFHDIFYSAIWLRVAIAEYQDISMVSRCARVPTRCLPP